VNAAAEWVIRRPVLAGLGVAGLVALLLTQCGGQKGVSEAAPPAMPTAAGTSTTVAAESTTEATATASEVEAPQESDVSRVAVRFVQAWLGDPANHAAWLAGIKPYATPALYAAYEQSPPL
jgi:hypothetical protein